MVLLQVKSVEAPAPAFLTKSSSFKATQLKLHGKVKTSISTCDVCPKEVCQMQSG